MHLHIQKENAFSSSDIHTMFNISTPEQRWAPISNPEKNPKFPKSNEVFAGMKH